MRKTKQVVTVEIVGTETQRAEDRITRWYVRRGELLATIEHWHDKADRDHHHGDGAWCAVSSDAGWTPVYERDFGAALAVARRHVGVRS